MSKIIGIDLGTTNSCVSFVDRGQPVVIPNAEGSRTTPSVVSVGKDGERRVGSVAKRQAVTNPENTVFAVKRLMGEEYDSETAKLHRSVVPYRVIQNTNGDAWVHIAGRDYAPQEISAIILEQMRATAESYIGETITEAVITVPAYFNDAQRAATKAAGKIAGLDVKRIINEPTAAAVAYGFEQREGQLIAVYDLGGGTFDISVLEIANGVFSVRATAGDTHLGGEDIDNAIVRELAQRFERETGIEVLGDRVAIQRLKEQAEKAKHELSTSLETEISLPFIASNATGPKHLETTLRRSELEILVGDLIERTLEPCRLALEAAGLTPANIDEVLLVGGQTRMPLVQRKVTEFFEREPHRGVNPDEVVAIGAAIQGAALTGEVEEVLLLDVTPLTLGVEVGGGVFHGLIPRNTTIPTRVTEIFTTSVDNQSFVPVHILQGEREMSVDNKSLAKFELAPIPPAPRGVPEIEVAFEIDANGTVSVTAKDLGTGKMQQVRVVASSGLSATQIDEMIADAARFKASDVERKQVAELRNGAEALLYTSERAVEDCGELVPADVIAAAKVAVAELKALLDARAAAPELKSGLERLEQSAYRITEHLYGKG